MNNIISTITENKTMTIGIVFLILGITLFAIGLKQESYNKFFFNISRSLVVVSAIGLWYFGNKNFSETELKLSESKKEVASALKKAGEAQLKSEEAKRETAKTLAKTKTMEIDVATAKKETAETMMKTKEMEVEVELARKETATTLAKTRSMEIDVATAKKETAETLMKTKEMEIDVSTAKKETQEAKKETEKLRLEVQLANLAVEKAKNDRELLHQKTALLGEQDNRLVNEQKKVTKFRVKLKIYFDTHITETGENGTNFGMLSGFGKAARINMINPNEYIQLVMGSEVNSQQIEPNVFVIESSYSPVSSNSILINDINVLNRFNEFGVSISMIEGFISEETKKLINLQGNGKMQLTLEVNGKEFKSGIYINKSSELLNKGIFATINIFAHCQEIIKQFTIDIEGEK